MLLWLQVQVVGGHRYRLLGGHRYMLLEVTNTGCRYRLLRLYVKVVGGYRYIMFGVTGTGC